MIVDQILPQFSDPPKHYWIWWRLSATVPGMQAARLYRKVIHSVLLLKKLFNKTDRTVLKTNK